LHFSVVRAQNRGKVGFPLWTNRIARKPRFSVNTSKGFIPSMEVCFVALYDAEEVFFIFYILGDQVKDHRTGVLCVRRKLAIPGMNSDSHVTYLRRLLNLHSLCRSLTQQSASTAVKRFLGVLLPLSTRRLLEEDRCRPEGDTSWRTRREFGHLSLDTCLF
jgi:hypothetical protein